MSKYLASIDLDDTLLRSDKSISESSKAFAQKFVNDGNFFIINTGRPHQGALQFLKELGIHQPIIVNNGTAIVTYDDDYNKITDYIAFSMNRNTIKKFTSDVSKFLQCELITCINDAYSYNFDSCPFWVIHNGSNVKFHQGNIPEILNHDPIKAEYWIYRQYKDEFEKILDQDEYKNEFEILRWEGHDNVLSYEISLKGTNKGSAVEFLAEKYGINKKNIFSFGDQLNDIPMIKIANYGVAMINSVDEVKRFAKYVSTYDFNNDGVVEFIKGITSK